jgi:hypothetical protein
VVSEHDVALRSGVSVEQLRALRRRMTAPLHFLRTREGVEYTEAGVQALAGFGVRMSPAGKRVEGLRVTRVYPAARRGSNWLDATKEGRPVRVRVLDSSRFAPGMLLPEEHLRATVTDGVVDFVGRLPRQRGVW